MKKRPTHRTFPSMQKNVDTQSLHAHTIVADHAEHEKIWIIIIPLCVQHGSARTVIDPVQEKKRCLDVFIAV